MGKTKQKLDQLRQDLSNLSTGPAQSVLDVDTLLFTPQRAFVKDETQFKTAICSRRAGKTVGCAAALLSSALTKAGSVSLYLTLSRINAKRIVWRTLLDLNWKYKLGGKVGEAELKIQLPNGSTVYLAGLNDKTEIDKYRGMPLGTVIIDEAQTIPPFLEELVDAVIVPGLMDYAGTLALVGTPGPVPNSYFHKCTTSPGWSHHSWTVFQNPWIEIKSKRSPQQHLEVELRRRGVNVSDPVVQREWYARWVPDSDSLVFKYDAVRNDYADLPPQPKKYEYVIGADLGFDDADAIAVLGWSESSPNLYLVEEWTTAKLTVSEMGQKLREVYDKYKPLAVVVDTGGLGRKIAEEIQKREEVPIEAAEKARKLEHIELLNDALRNSRFYAKRDGRFALDCALVEWDRTNPERPKIAGQFHSDICDAVLYAYRKALHWLYVPPTPRLPEIGTPAWCANQVNEMEAQEVAMWEAREAERKEAEAWATLS